MGRSRSSEHLNAQKAVKELEEYQCFFCGRIDKKAHGHHVIYYSEGGPASERLMITLCPPCHRGYHNGKLKIDLGCF